MSRRAAAMINLVAIGLVLSTLAAAGVWSPAPKSPPPAQQQHGGVDVVREGRSMVIVEFERELDGSLKEKRVLSSHPLAEEGEGGARVLDQARGVVSDAADKVAGAAGEGKERLDDAKEGGVLGAVKRCKDRLCGAGRRVEESAKDAASRAEHGAEDAVRGARETVSDARDSAENKAFDAAQRGKETLVSARDKASEVASQGKEAVKSAKGKVSEAAEKAKEKASNLEHGAVEAAKNAKDSVSEAAKNVKHSAEDTVRGARDKASHIAERAEEYAHDAAGNAADKAAEAEEAVKAKAGEVRENLTGVARRARSVASNAAAYLLGGRKEAARTATAVMHLLGFATAFGACIWVTFMSSYVLAAALPRQQLGMLQSKLYPVYFRVVAYGIGLALAAHLLGAERSSVATRAQSFNLLAALGLVLANMLLLEPKATNVMFERMKVEKEEGRGEDMSDIVDPPAATVSTTATYAAAAARAEAAATRTPAVPSAATRTPAVPSVATGKASTPATVMPAMGKATGDAEVSKSRVLRLNKRLKDLNSYSSLCNALSLMALSWHLVHLARRLLTGTAC